MTGRAQPTPRFLSAILVLALTAPALAGPRLIKVPVRDRHDREVLAGLGCEIVGHEPGHFVLAVPADGPMAVRASRVIGRWPGAIVIEEDADRLVAAARPKDDPLGGYHDLAGIVREIQEMAAQRPDLCQVRSIGKSFEGRDILALRIALGETAPWGRPVTLFMGAHHAREWISYEVPLGIARHLVRQADADQTVRDLLNKREVWVVPVVNPDGVHWSHTQSKYWRKNRRKNEDGSFGVDPNRNYSYKWGTAGDSSWPGSDVYRGAGPFSEPETQTMRDFALEQMVTASISFHSHGELVLYPWSYGYDPAPDKAVFERVAQALAGANEYTPQQSADLYPSSGDTDDFMYGETGSLSFTVELASSFIPSAPQIPGIVEANVKAAMVLIESAADPFPFMVHRPEADVQGTGPWAITARFDAAHHPKFTPQEVVLVATVDGREVTMPMAAGADAVTYQCEIPRPEGPDDVRYLFGLADSRGRRARTPRLTEFALRRVPPTPPSLWIAAP